MKYKMCISNFFYNDKNGCEKYFLSCMFYCRIDRSSHHESSVLPQHALAYDFLMSFDKNRLYKTKSQHL